VNFRKWHTHGSNASLIGGGWASRIQGRYHPGYMCEHIHQSP